MKKNFIYITAIFLVGMFFRVGQLCAQDSREANTLLGSGISLSKKDLGFFVAPAYGFTRLDGTNASLFHVRGGLGLKDRWSLGGFYTVSLNEIVPRSETWSNVYMDYWVAGGFLEYTLLSKRLLHLTFPLYVGYGEVEMDSESWDIDFGESNFVQIEPSALLELNLHKHVRFNVGAGYRLVGPMNYRNFNEANMSNLTGYVGLKIGLFR